MKLVLFTLAVFAVSLGSAVPRYSHPTTYGIKEDIDDFLALIPREQVQNIIVEYIAHDAEVQETMQYLVSEDFKQLLLDTEGIPDYREFLEYLQDSGLNVYYYLNKLHELVGLPPFVPMTVITGTGVRGMLDDIKAILPIQKIKDLYYKKLETSPAFYNLITKMREDEFKGIINHLGENPRFQQLVQRARDQGVDVELVREILNKIFGWGI